MRGGLATLDLARRAGVDEATARALAEGVVDHITPGAGAGGATLAALVQAGAMVELTGLRLQDLDARFVDEVHARHPREGATEHLGACWQAEAAAFAEGRTAFLETRFLFSLLIRHSPHAAAPEPADTGG